MLGVAIADATSPVCPECGLTTPPTPGHAPARRRRWVPWVGLLAGVVALAVQWSGTRQVGTFPGQGGQWWRGITGRPHTSDDRYAPARLAEVANGAASAAPLARHLLAQRDVLVTGSSDTIMVWWCTPQMAWYSDGRGWPIPVVQRYRYGDSRMNSATTAAPTTYAFQAPATVVINSSAGQTTILGDALLLLGVVCAAGTWGVVRLTRRVRRGRRAGAWAWATVVMGLGAFAWMALVPTGRGEMVVPYLIEGQAEYAVGSGAQLAEWAARGDGDRLFAGAMLSGQRPGVALAEAARPVFRAAPAGFKFTRRVSYGWPGQMVLVDLVGAPRGVAGATWLDPGVSIAFHGPYLRIVPPVAKEAGNRRAYSIHAPGCAMLGCGLGLCYAIPWLVCYGAGAWNARRWSRSGRCQHCGYTLMTKAAASASCGQQSEA